MATDLGREIFFKKKAANLFANYLGAVFKSNITTSVNGEIANFLQIPVQLSRWIKSTWPNKVKNMLKTLQ